MKTQTAEEYLENCSYYVDPSLLTDFATTQIEVLRGRLMKNAPSVLAGVSIEQVINQFLKELSDGKR